MGKMCYRPAFEDVPPLPSPGNMPVVCLLQHRPLNFRSLSFVPPQGFHFVHAQKTPTNGDKMAWCHLIEQNRLVEHSRSRTLTLAVDLMSTCTILFAVVAALTGS